MILFHMYGISLGSNGLTSNETFTRVENAANIYVGSKNFIQKINFFYINDSSVKCTERYLPIIFLMTNSQNKEQVVDGYLTEYGNLVDHQESIHCRIFKKYFKTL